MYRNINLSCRLFKITAPQVNSKVALTIFYYINTPGFKKFHTKAVEGKVCTTTSRESSYIFLPNPTDH